MSADRVRRVFGPALDEVSGPFCSALAEGQIDHESGGRERVVVADKVNGGSELGGAAIYVAHGESGRPLPRGYGPARWNLDPFHPYSTVVMQQLMAADLLRDLTKALMDGGFRVPASTEPAIWNVFFLLRHSIGTVKGSLIPLLRRASAATGSKNPSSLVLWCERAGAGKMPKIGRQSPGLVYKRICRCLAVVRHCTRMPPVVQSSVSFDPSKVAPFNSRVVRLAIVAERKRAAVGGARNADGSA